MMQTEQTARRVLTPEDVAERWQCSPQQVRKLLGAGKLAGFRLGGKLWRVRIEDVEEFECVNTSSSASVVAGPLQSMSKESASAVSSLARVMRERRLRNFEPS